MFFYSLLHHYLLIKTVDAELGNTLIVLQVYKQPWYGVRKYHTAISVISSFSQALKMKGNLNNER